MADIDQFLDAEVSRKAENWPKYAILGAVIICIVLTFIDGWIASRAWIFTACALANVGILFIVLEFMDPEVTFVKVFTVAVIIALSSQALYIITLGTFVYTFLWFSIIWPIYKIYFPQLTFWKIILISIAQWLASSMISFAVESIFGIS